MNIEQRKYEALRTRSGYNLYSELHLLSAIEKYEADGFILPKYQQAFEEQVAYIAQNCPNINDISNKNIGKIFHTQKTERQDTIRDLIYFEVGKQESRNAAEVTLSKLATWADACMEHSFYIGYQIPKDRIKELINDMPAVEQIIDKSRSMYCSRDELLQMCQTSFDMNLSEDELISNVNIYNDGAYTLLPLGIDDLIWFCQREKYWDLWLDIYEKLCYIPLQGYMFYRLQSVEECIELQDEFGRKDRKKAKVFAFLLRAREFELFREEECVLIANREDKDLKDNGVKNYLEFVWAMSKEWEQKYSEYVQKCVAFGYRYFNHEDFIGWITKKREFTTHKATIYAQIENKFLDCIENIIKNRVVMPNVLDNLTLQELLTYTKLLANNISKEDAKRLINAICDVIFLGDNLSKQWTLDEKGLEEIRCVYECLELSGEDGYDLMVARRQPDEGYQRSYDAVLKTYRSDSLWLSVLMLQGEYHESPEEFEKVCDMLYRLARIEEYGDDFFYIPFLTGELIVTQVLQECKEAYEKRLLSISNLVFVLRVLYANQGNISDDVKIILLDRIEKEWSMYKEMYQPIDRGLFEDLDQYVSKLFIEDKSARLK